MSSWARALFFGIASGFSPAVVAQFETAFEPPSYKGSPAGTALSGQDGFYVPLAGDIDGRCFTYAGNVLGMAANPLGGEQFVAVTRATGAFGRVEHAVPIDVTAAGACWAVECDINLLFVGTLPTDNYAGSISLQPFPGAGSVIFLFYWDDPDTAQTFTMRVIGYDRAGTIPYLAGLPIDAPAFHGLAANRWYRVSHRVDFAANAVTGMSVRDIAAAGPTHGFVTYVDPTLPASGHIDGYYLGGGDTFHGAPVACRIFSGGGFNSGLIPGNTLAVDNLRIVPYPQATCPSDIDFNGRVDVQDLAHLLSHFGTPGGATFIEGDLDCDGTVDHLDLEILLGDYGTICP